MVKFRGRIWLARDATAELASDIDIQGDRIRITSGDDDIGDWVRSEIDLRARDDGVHLFAEGEELVLQSDEVGFEAALMGPPTSPTGVASRIRAASRGAHVAPVTKPWLRRWWVVVGGVVVALGIIVTTWNDEPTPSLPLAQIPSSTSDESDAHGTASTEPSVNAVTTVDTSASTSASAVIAQVVNVIDGDTIRVRLPDGVEEPVRLIGIDAVERGLPISDQATAYLIGLVQGKRVRLISDVSDRDQFDRLLRYVYVEDVFVNEAMVTAGLATAVRYPPDTAMAATLEAAQADAQAAGVGGWTPVWRLPASGHRTGSRLRPGYRTLHTPRPARPRLW
jgi:micrococcal nuclease